MRNKCQTIYSTISLTLLALAVLSTSQAQDEPAIAIDRSKTPTVGRPATNDGAFLQKATLQHKIRPGDGAEDDRFAGSVSVSGNYMIAGAYNDDAKGTDSGAAYIFKRSGNVWSQTYKLTAGDGTAEDKFGCSVSISGDYAVSGARYDDDRGTNSGAVYIFKHSGEAWIQQAKLTADDGGAGDQFGYSVSIFGDTIVASAYNDNDKGTHSGSAYIFKRSGDAWIHMDKITAGDGAAVDWFGYSVSISGNTIIVGSPKNDNSKGTDSGAAYLFKRSGDNWIQQVKLTANDGAFGDFFGFSVSNYHNYTVVGAWRNDDDGTDSGAVYVFKGSNNAWTLQQKLTADDGASIDRFGLSVSISGSYIVVGATGDDDKETCTGSAYIFHRTGDSWTQEEKLTTADAAAYDWFGTDVSISGGYAIVGTLGDDDNGSNSGSAYAYQITDNPEGCPAFTGNDITITNMTIPYGYECECTASSSITLGPDLTIANGSTLSCNAPEIKMKALFKVEEGANLITSTP